MLFSTYLSNRHQAVYLHGEYSNVLNVNNGVPQGSVLGPLLFLIMINDFSPNVDCDSILFADDTTLYNSNNDTTELNIRINKSINDSQKWFQVNGLCLNINKTQQIQFSLKDGNNLNALNEVKLLGITLDSKLSWAPHIDTVCVKLSRVVCMLRNIKRLVPINYLKSAYYSIFNSILVYGVCLWGNGSGISKISYCYSKRRQ